MSKHARILSHHGCSSANGTRFRVDCLSFWWQTLLWGTVATTGVQSHLNGPCQSRRIGLNARSRLTDVMISEHNDRTFVYALTIIGTIVVAVVAAFAYPVYINHKEAAQHRLLEAAERLKRDADLERALDEIFGISDLPISASQDPTLTKIAKSALLEPCDWILVSTFSKELVKANQRRNAAKLYEYYDGECARANNATWQAANIYEQIGDFAGALRAIERFIKDTAENPDGYYLRARANDQIGNAQKAISDYLTTIALINDPSKTGYGVFRNLARAYEAEGSYCEAAAALMSWAAANNQHENSQVQYLIETISKKGSCLNNFASGEDTFRYSANSDGVIYTDVLINGKKGRFIVDTGAALVSISSSFAKRLSLTASSDSEIKLSTANGLTTGYRITLDNVAVGEVTASAVQGVLMQNEKAFPENLDGLLGRSFLARFDVSFGQGRWSLKSRNN